MKKSYVYGGIVLSMVVPVGYLYTTFFVRGDSANKFEREAFIAHGSDKFEVTILNGSGVTKVYQAVSKVTSEPSKDYYYFWANVGGKRVYIQSPMSNTLIEEK